MFIICHYGEIALKGKNRKFFEECLIDNIKKTFQSNGVLFELVRRISGRILIKLKDEANKDRVKEALQNVFGITGFAFVEKCLADIVDIKELAIILLKEQSFNTFRVSAKRSEKTSELTSQTINEQVGEFIIEKLNKKVSLKTPELTLFIEVVEKQAYLYAEKIAGLGGLPVGVSGKAICLLSGGIDSPVASFLAMKRGLEVIFLHFHALPYVDKASVDKVKELAQVLAKYQNSRAKLYLVAFADIQKEILLKTKEDLRVVLYRRFMFKIAESIAQKEKAKALLTGENLGQVASQTLENMAVIEKASDLLVLRPLLCFDKQEIIEKAKSIGTYQISALSQQDCCSRFLPNHPETRANIKEVLSEEKKLNTKKLICAVLKNLITERFNG